MCGLLLLAWVLDSGWGVFVGVLRGGFWFALFFRSVHWVGGCASVFLLAGCALVGVFSPLPSCALGGAFEFFVFLRLLSVRWLLLLFSCVVRLCFLRVSAFGVFCALCLVALWWLLLRPVSWLVF